MNEPTIIEYCFNCDRRFIAGELECACNDPQPVALLRLVPCGTCGGKGHVTKVDQDAPIGDGTFEAVTRRCSADNCWGGWVPKDGTREWRCDHAMASDNPAAILEACSQGRLIGLLPNHKSCRWVWVLPERTD